MKYLLITLFSIIVVNKISAQINSLKEKYKKYGIVKVESVYNTTNSKLKSVTYYDHEGNDIKLEISDSNYFSTTYKEYKDSLLTSLKQLQYNDGILSDSSITKYIYSFDERGRVISNMMINNLNEIVLTKLFRGTDGEIDTIYTYEGIDSSLLKLTNRTIVTKKDDQTYFLSCNLLGDTCTIQANTYSDSLYFSLEQLWSIKDGKMVFINAKISRTYFEDGVLSGYETSDGIKNRSYFEKDERGLIIFERRINSWHNKIDESTVSYKYFTRSD